MREGSLEAPTRHPIAWQDDVFYDPAAIDAELRRVFDICHGCRRCFNLCDSFPRLFDLIDASKTGELDAVDSDGFQAGRRCLHALRHVLHDEVPVCAAARVQPRFPASDAALSRDGGEAGQASRSPTGNSPRPIATASWRPRCAGIANWATDRANKTMRGLLEQAAGLDRDAALPKYASKPLTAQAKDGAGGEPRRAGVRPQGGALRHLLRQLQRSRGRHGDPRRAGAQRRRDRGRLSALLRHAAAGARAHRRGRGERRRSSRAPMRDWIDKGYDIIALVPSCALMLKFEWPLILPDDARCRGAVEGDLRHQRIRRRHRPQGRPGAGAASRCQAASRCTWPAMRGRRTWGRRRPRCCACCRMPMSR